MKPADISKIVVANGTKFGFITEEQESHVFVEPYPSYIPMSPDEPVDPDKIGGWHKKEDVVPLAEHIESLKVPKEELERKIKYGIFCSHIGEGVLWFRLFGFGLYFKDTNKHPLLFSERMGVAKRFKIKSWSISILRP